MNDVIKESFSISNIIRAWPLIVAIIGGIVSHAVLQKQVEANSHAIEKMSEEFQREEQEHEQEKTKQAVTDEKLGRMADDIKEIKQMVSHYMKLTASNE